LAAGGALVATPIMGLSGKMAWISLREALDVKLAFLASLSVYTL
jgi:hypothetical protein